MNESEAERYLSSLELFGMRFGLDRMRRLMTALDHPERRFRSIHVVGTNGKSSTSRMVAAILTRHGLRTGAYLSPHLVSFGERIRVDDHDLEPARFAAAVARAARAAELVNRAAAEDDHVTQFEALTAAAYSELAEREVEVAVVEAGLGGRYDATNVLPSAVQVLTSVGLEHTRWLGPTLADIAREKLAVVKPGGTLVLGAELDAEVAQIAEAVADEQGARLVRAGVDPGVAVGAPGAYQRRNFALARAVAEAFLGQLDETAVAAAAAEVRVPGRLQEIAIQPVTLLDGAHNPDGMRALVQSLPELAERHDRLVAVISILDDKDAAAMLRSLLPVCTEVVFTRSTSSRSLPPPTLQSLANQLGGPPSEVMRDPVRALHRARILAGPGGLVIATGSLTLVADLLVDAQPDKAQAL
ncbi:MAG TPA: cyanophycin synthetase [Solirubrobacteraceae bacterium]|jgi:dihydrofolate synthase/folylpolyglutamate synthase|nr:cyanophycin synthetase [Solirubrobacteraceae bacterium]